jgi:Mlc titration factor MtfA (ptsG expression regulator)
MLLSWLQRRRRRRLLAEPLADAWRDVLQQNVRHYGALTAEDQRRLDDRLRVFVAEKHWEGCGGLELTDEVRVTIAGQASVLLLGVEDYYFDGVRSVLVYPSTFADPGERRDGFLVERGVALHGEAHGRGPIVLSWDAVLRGARRPERGHNVVIHEFAHHLDALDGYFDGAPPLARQSARRWQEVADREYERLVHSAERGRRTLLDHYGATNRAEFFAVAVECFFCRPAEMRELHAELYELLREFFRLDPAGWETLAAEGSPAS